MIILRKGSNRDAWISGYKEGANAVLRDSLEEASKTPVKYNGKALREMLDYTEEMEDKIPEMAELSYEEKDYSEVLQDVITDCLDKIDTMKIGKFTVMSEESGDDTVVLSGGLNGRGIWSNYFEVLSRLMFQIELRYPDAYVINLKNDTLDDVFYLTIRIPKDSEQKEFGEHEPPKQGNKKPGNREIVPDYIVQKVKNGEGVIHKYKGYWRIVSMKTNPPTFWDVKSDSKEKCEKILAAYHSNKH
jgi:hypothetical protein